MTIDSTDDPRQRLVAGLRTSYDAIEAGEPSPSPACFQGSQGFLSFYGATEVGLW